MFKMELTEGGGDIFPDEEVQLAKSSDSTKYLENDSKVNENLSTTNFELSACTTLAIEITEPDKQPKNEICDSSDFFSLPGPRTRKRWRDTNTSKNQCPQLTKRSGFGTTC